MRLYVAHFSGLVVNGVLQSVQQMRCKWKSRAYWTMVTFYQAKLVNIAFAKCCGAWLAHVVAYFVVEHCLPTRTCFFCVARAQDLLEVPSKVFWTLASRPALGFFPPSAPHLCLEGLLLLTVRARVSTDILQVALNLWCWQKYQDSDMASQCYADLDKGI